MYGFTLHVPAPIDAYRAMHKAVLEVLSDGVPMDGPQSEPIEFTPTAVMTPRAFSSDAVS